MDSALLQIFVALPILVFSAVLHEIGHGLAAERLGDPTARALGRITLNPIPHIDLLMTILLPLSLLLAGSPVIFGGAKPVPVDPRYFQNPKTGMGLVAIAGPIVNFVLALLGLVIVHSVAASLPAGTTTSIVVYSLSIFIIINMVLGLFNLLPVPPLDGGRIAIALLPLPLARVWAKLEPYGLFIVAALLLSGVVSTFLGSMIEMVITWLPT